MANPQTEDGYTRIANELLEALSGIRISGEARQILDVILRKTYGFGKKEDKISISQFCTMTKMGDVPVCRGIKKLIDMALITKKDNEIANIYSINKDFSSWKPLPKKITIIKKDNQRYQKSKSSLSKKIDTKETLTKETLTKEIVSSGASPAPWILEEKLKKMEEVENSALDIIATFIREKRVPVENSKQLSSVIGRFMRVATEISGGYSNKQILAAIDQIKADNASRVKRKQDTVDWTVNTILKFLTK